MNVDAIDNLLLSNASQHYSYDAADRLTGLLGAYGSLGFEYDANSNRIAFVDDGLRDDYEIRFSNNWLLETGNGSVVRSYDANGNQIQAGADVFTYDSQSRLVSATVAGVTAEYGYNHLHQRVTKTLNGHVRLMLYDQAGNLLSEVDSATGQTLAEYVWLDGAPLAFIEAGNTYQIHDDHLGTPQVLTDGSGQVAWEAHYTPFGRASVLSQGPTFNLRFPGQYFDAETGLHYNWHRYYDPAIGRYITSDPIGLTGGLNTYGYVGGNPINRIDPMGLFCGQACDDLNHNGISDSSPFEHSVSESGLTCDAFGSCFTSKQIEEGKQGCTARDKYCRTYTRVISATADAVSIWAFIAAPETAGLGGAIAISAQFVGGVNWVVTFIVCEPSWSTATGIPAVIARGKLGAAASAIDAAANAAGL